jgi:ABC-2 type transport system permease protein
MQNDLSFNLLDHGVRKVEPLHNIFDPSVGVSTFFYAANTLFDENKDRSAQFWQSLPTSNRMVVLSKLTMALVVAPSIGIIIAIVFAVITAGIHSLVAMKYGPNIFIHLIGNPLFFRQCAELFMMLPFYCLWALPTVAWLLVVSALARSKPALWAGGIPMIITGLVMLFDKAFDTARDPDWALNTILGRAIGSVIPGAWSKFGAPKYEMSINQNSGDFSPWRVVLHHAFDLSTTANLWIGVVLGIVFLCIAIRLRGSRG